MAHLTSPTASPAQLGTSPAAPLTSWVLRTGPVAVAVTIVVAVLTGATSASAAPPAWVPWVALGCLALGIPHGAVDNLVLLGAEHRGRSAAMYVLAAAAATGGILLWPAPAFGAVIALSVWHFGSGDVESLSDLGNARRETRPWSIVHALVLGSVPLVLPLTGGSTGATLALIQHDLPQLGQAASGGARIVTLLLALVVVVHLATTGRRAAAAEILLLAALGLVVTPLLAFGVYFATWHALRHTARLAQDGAGAVHLRPLVRVVAAGLPALALTAAAVTLTLVTVGDVRRPGLWLWAGLALVWGLTVPHMVVVGRFDVARRRAVATA